MPRRLPPGRVNEEDHVASPEVSRLLVTGFLVAALLGHYFRLGVDRLEPAHSPCFLEA